MALRPDSRPVRPSVPLAHSAHRGHPGKDKDAGGTGAVRAETCGKGWQALQVPQVPLHDGEPQRIYRQRGRRQPHHTVRGYPAAL